MEYLVEVEKATATVGPAYRNVSCSLRRGSTAAGTSSVDKYPESPMLGRRTVIDGKAGEYSWMTYKEVHEVVMKLAASINKLGIKQGQCCGIYGANCPEWIISMEACNALGVCCVPLYDSLGHGALQPDP